MTRRRTSYDEEDTFEIIETLGHSAAKQDFHCGQEFREVTSEWTVELQTKVRQDFTITEMASTRAFSLLRHYGKLVPKHGEVSRREMLMLMLKFVIVKFSRPFV